MIAPSGLKPGKWIKILFHLVVFALATILTQIGGVIYWISLWIGHQLQLTRASMIGIFTGIYLISTFIFIPLLAPVFGRVPLPLSGSLKPLNLLTVFFNRHYVTPELKVQLMEITSKFDQQYEGISTNYLDANFPFCDGFPLFPHLSHNDGRKIDLAFQYVNRTTNEPSGSAPSFIGYGIFEDPVTGEINYPKICKEQGFWQYGWIAHLVPEWHGEDYSVDIGRTKMLIEYLAQHPLTSKIFIEPHLKVRWGLTGYEKIRFHGCQAVRHDDHIHMQIK